jgi:hypothetical protein
MLHDVTDSEPLAAALSKHSKVARLAACQADSPRCTGGVPKRMLWRTACHGD